MYKLPITFVSFRTTWSLCAFVGRKCHSKGVAWLPIAAAAIGVVLVIVLMFSKDWTMDSGEGSGYMVKLKIVITHMQVPQSSHTTSAVTCDAAHTVYKATPCLKRGL